MTGDEAAGDALQELVERVKVEKGRQISRLVHSGGLEPKQTFELRGRIFALNGVLHIIENGEGDIGDLGERSELFRELAEADQTVFDERLEEMGADDEDDDDPVNHNAEVY